MLSVAIFSGLLTLVAPAPNPDVSPDSASARMDFRWTGPATCPTQEQVSDMLGELLTVPLDASTTSYVSMIGTLRAEDQEGYFLRLYVVTPSGTRERDLRHHSCDRLTRIAVLIMATAIDPGVFARLDDESLKLLSDTDTAPPGAGDEGASEEEDPLEASGDPAEQDSLDHTERPAESPLATAPARARWFADLGLEGGASYGVLPGWAGSLSGTIAVGRVVSGELRVGGDFPVERTVAPEAILQFSAWRAGLSGCFDFLSHRSASRWELPGCFGFELGQLIGRGSGPALDDPQRHADWWVAVPLDLGVRFRALGGFGVELRGLAWVRLNDPSFEVTGVGTVHRPARIGMRALLGVYWRVGT